MTDTPIPFPSTRNPLVRRAIDTLLEGLYPPACVRCGEALFARGGSFLCEDCHDLLQFIGEGACRLCGAPTGEHADLGRGCAECRPHAHRFTRAAAVTRYDDASREIVHAFKFAGERRLADPLSALMAARVLDADFPAAYDRVLPVPLHKRRLGERGYNQSALLAKRIAKHLNSPYDGESLQRTRDTQAQAMLKRAERLTNPVGAFGTSGKFERQTLLLVDDVLTTGSTVSECAGSLRAAGASRVYVIVFAR